MNRSARFSERAILYGDGPLAIPLMEEIGSRADLGVRVVGFVGNSAETDRYAASRAIDEDDLEDMVAEHGVRRIVITMGDRRGKMQVQQLLRLKTRGVYIQDGPEYYESITGKIPLDSLRLSWLIFSPGISCTRRPAFVQANVFLDFRQSGHPDYLTDHAAGGAGRSPGLDRAGQSFGRSALAKRQAVHGFQIPVDV